MAINLIVQHIQDILNGDICKWQRGAINGRSLKRAISEQNDLHNGVSSSTAKRALLEPSCRPHWSGADEWMFVLLMPPSSLSLSHTSKNKCPKSYSVSFQYRREFLFFFFTVIIGKLTYSCRSHLCYVTVFRHAVNFFHFQLPISTCYWKWNSNGGTNSYFNVECDFNSCTRISYLCASSFGILLFKSILILEMSCCCFTCRI